MKYNILFALLFFILLPYTSCTKKIKSDKNAFEMSEVMFKKCEYSKVINYEVYSDLKLFGKVAADNNKSANVYSIMGGSVEKIYVELGDYVKQGQLLANIKSSEVASIYQQKLDAQANYALAKKNLQVATDLFEGKLNTEKDVIAARKDLEMAEAELARINEIYSIYSLSGSSTYNIKAPISGYIVRKDISPNEVLNKDVENVLFSIAEIKDIWVIANVNEADIGKIRLGYDADVETISYPDKIYKGKVDKIFNVIDPETKALKIVIKIPNEDISLKPEMNAIVKLHYSEGHKMLGVPSSAIIFDENRKWVVVFRNKSDVEVREVNVYKENNGICYIDRGLNENETVISKNGIFIYDALGN